MHILNYITWNPTPEIFGNGTYIRWYGLLFAMGFFFAYVILYHVYKREKIAVKYLDILTVYIFIATVIGARLGHVFFYEWNYYKDHLVEILFIWEGGLASHGAGIAIVLALILYARLQKVNLLWLFDRISIVIPVTAAFVRFGNLMNSEIYGHPTTMPWGFIFKNGKEIMDRLPLINKPCHPTQLYEAFSYLLLSLVLYLVWRKKDTKPRNGLLVGIFLTGMFTARLLIEFFKIRQEKFINNTFFDMGQYLSIPFIALGIFFLVRAFRKKEVTTENEKIPPHDQKG